MNAIAEPLSITGLDGVRETYERGLYLTAYEASKTLGPIATWRGPEARILAGRLAGNLGNVKIADWHFIHAYREAPTHPESLWYYAHYLLNRWGPWKSWKFLQAQTFPEDASVNHKSHWCSLHAAVLSRFRDFDEGEAWLKKAEALDEQPWNCLEWAGLYALADRHADAEAAARRALEMRPWYRPAVQWVAHFLVQRERDEEALELLTEATQRLESGSVHHQLASLLIELRRYDEATQHLDHYERLSPLMQKEFKWWMAARRADLACFRSDSAAAREYALEAAKQKSAKFYEELAERIAHPDGPTRRVILPVGFVQQHHLTCATATLAALCRHWSMPGDHLEMAQEMSYAGTPHHSERRWARERGWVTREFRVTWEAACDLIDRGVPFTLTTNDITTSHLQAVIGYDTLRQTLIVRDPSFRHQMELPFKDLIERNRSIGPRGMALVPMAFQEKLDGLELPDEPLYDHLHRLDLALEKHKRDEAHAEFQALQEAAPDHLLAALARYTLAAYDHDSPSMLAAVERLLELFPDDLRWGLSRAGLLREMGRRTDRLAMLRSLTESRFDHPAAWAQYASELADDARDHSRALYILRRSLRTNPSDPLMYATRSRILWARRQYEDSLQLQHFATCLGDKDELLARDYFQASRILGKTERVLGLIQRRFERFGNQSSLPARTLYWALTQLERISEAGAVLDRALQLRPQDGELLTYVAEMKMFVGEFAEADAVLEKAKGLSQEGIRLRNHAILARHQGRLDLAKERWRAVVAREPLAEDAHRSLTLVIAETEGRPAALVHLRDVCSRFPQHFGLNRLLLEWTREEGNQSALEVIRRLVDLHPADAWTRRELALTLTDMGQLQEAQKEMDEAARLDPLSPSLHSSRAYLYRRLGKNPEAKQALREAIRLSVDTEMCHHELMDLCETLDERREELRFIEAELIRQVTFGAGLLSFRDLAQAVIPAEELLETLQRGLRDRPDLWQSWCAVARQLISMGNLEKASEVAKQAVDRFPLRPELWIELAAVQENDGDASGAIASLERAVQLLPGWSTSNRKLADAHERKGDFQAAQRVLEQAIAREPLNSMNHLDLAEVIWRQGDDGRAIGTLFHAMKLDPGNESAWNRLAEWTSQKNRFDEVVALAREWTVSRSGEARSWMRLGQTLSRQGRRDSIEADNARLDECARCFDRAIELNPQLRHFHDLKAEVLALAGRFEQARAACQHPIWDGKIPLDLRGRLAWISFVEGNLRRAESEIRAVLLEDRNYYWGWTQLADWCLQQGKNEDYLRAADEMVRLSPRTAQALAYRGEARLKLGQRDGGLEDLRQAHAIDPAYSMAGFLLFDEQMNDSQYEAADATLKSLQQCVGGDLVKVREIDLLAKKELKQLALDAFRILCASPLPNTLPLDHAIRHLDQAGWRAEVEAVLRDTLNGSEWNPHIALVFAERWNPSDSLDLPGRIAALDRGLQKQPASLRLLDFKAELLVNGGRFEEALVVTKQPTFERDQYALDGRRAWVLNRWGKTALAIETMCAILKEHPSYHWGWLQIAEWYETIGEWQYGRTSADEIIKLDPKGAVGYGHRGLCELRLGHEDAAIAAFDEALRLSPSYSYAAWQLLDIRLKHRNYPQAERLLSRVKDHVDPGDWWLRKVDLRILQEDRKHFGEDFGQLCEQAVERPFLLEQSLQFVVQSGWQDKVTKVLREFLDRGQHFCDQWVRAEMLKGATLIPNKIGKLPAGPGRTGAIAAYAMELAWSKNANSLAAWVGQNRDAITADTKSWARIGEAYHLAGDAPNVVHWLSTYRDHPDATTLSLLPLVQALQGQGKVGEATEVIDYALSQLKQDIGTSRFLVWQAFEQALNGQTDPPKQMLETLDLGSLDGYHQFLVAMVRALVQTQFDAQNGYALAKRTLIEAAVTITTVAPDAALKACYQRCVASIARCKGTLGAKVWRLTCWLFPTLPHVKTAQ